MMADYSIQDESSRILNDALLSDPRLNLSPSIAEASKKIRFVGDDSKPFVPSPLKMTESSAALNALLAAAASAVASERYNIPLQDIEVNTDVATLFLESVLLPTVNGTHFLQNEKLANVLKEMDIYDTSKSIHSRATNVYQTKDGRWYHLHGSMNSGPTMKMMGVEEAEVSADEALRIYAEKVAQWNSQDLERVANEEFRQAGVVCYTPEEFFSSEHGKIIAQEPLWNTKSRFGPRKPWPQLVGEQVDFKPLSGIKVIDFSRVIAAPACSKMLAVLGAEVIRVSNSRLPDYAATMLDLQTGKFDTDLDLRTDEGKEAFIRLVRDADVLMDGYRPGALKRLGFDSQTLRELNPSLIYMRENCYGFKGPLAYRSGWQQISDCLVGISWLQGKFLGLDEAVVPLLPNSDYQTGLVGAIAAIQALLARSQDDVTFDVDVSLTQYNIWYYRLGLYTEEQQQELRARHPEFTSVITTTWVLWSPKTNAAFQKVRPDLFSHPEYFWKMSLKEYGLEDGEEALILRPAFKFDRSKLEYAVPSGRRGRSKAEWSLGA